MTGVSVDIGTSFVKPGGKAGDVLTAKATITGIGELHVPPLKALNCSKDAQSDIELYY